MTARRITAPDPVVTLAEAKAHLRVDHTDDDEAIQAYTDAATAYFDGLDGILTLALGPQAWELPLDAFPAAEIRSPLGPVVSVDAVEYTDPDGATQAVPAENYAVDSYPREAWIVPNTAWPATMATINAVRVRWTAGAGCPAPVRSAILLLLGHLYANREAVAPKIDELPLGIYVLAAPYRTVFV